MTTPDVVNVPEVVATDAAAAVQVVHLHDKSAGAAAIRSRMNVAQKVRETVYLCHLCGTAVVDEKGTEGLLAEHPAQECCARASAFGEPIFNKVFVDSLVFGPDGKVTASQRA